MTDCPHCAVSDGLYSWVCDNCCARFLSRVPTKELRQGWLERWTKQFNAERVSRIRALVELWKLWPRSGGIYDRT